ncbi:MAG: type IV secretory system conjugative DNA transfer family protein, partial [bacterium]|nr:type IV secretory system conjugative DNA transfer family protein [bacterium]
MLDVLFGGQSGNRRPKRSYQNELGSGDLAPKKLIKPWLTPKDELDTPLYVTGVRGGDGIACRDGQLYIPNEERNRHVLIIAKTGSGKTTRFILPVLYADCISRQRSTVVIDSKPEMWEKLAGLTQKYNPEKNIMLFNPLDTMRSLSWNILSKVHDDTDAKLIANTVIMATDNPSSKGDSPFFRNNALQLLTAMMLGCLNDPNDRLSMPRVHELIHSGKEPLCAWLEAHPAALRISRTFIELARSGSQNADTVLSELGMRLSAWDLHNIRATTFSEELDLEKLVSEPTLLIVELRESEIEMLRPIANVIVIEILRFLTKRAESCPGHKLPRPVGFVIDEFASALGRLPDIHVKLNTLRSRNVSIVAAIQSIAQIKANYDKDADSVLSGFSTKILMP